MPNSPPPLFGPTQFCQAVSYAACPDGFLQMRGKYPVGVANGDERAESGNGGELHGW